MFEKVQKQIRYLDFAGAAGLVYATFAKSSVAENEAEGWWRPYWNTTNR